MATIFVVRPRTGNIGNDLIALGADAFLRRAFGRSASIVTLASANSSGKTPGGGLNAANIYEINRLADGVVLGPGNLFENGGLVCDLDALASLSVPMMLFSVSAGHIYDRSGCLVPRTDSLSAQKIVAICRAAEPQLLRDEASCTYLSRLGLSGLEVGGCPSLFLDAAEGILPARDEAVAGATLISLRAPSLMSVPYSVHAKLRAEIGRLIEWLESTGHAPVKLLCHDYRDLAFAAEFPMSPALYTEDLRQYLGWLRDCALNVSFRLHAFLPCLMLGTPSISLSYDQRSISLIETIGMAEWDINFIGHPDVLGAIRERAGNLGRLEELKRRARPRWEALRAMTEKAIANFFARVEKRQSALQL